MSNFAIEIQPGRFDAVMRQISHHLTDFNRLPAISQALGTVVITATTKNAGITAEMLTVDGVIGVEGRIEHVFYTLPPMLEATDTRPISPADLVEILESTPRTDVGAAFPLGAPGFSRGREASPWEMAAGGWEQTLDMIGAREAWKVNQGDASVIAVIDSGLDAGTVDLDRQLIDRWPAGVEVADFEGHGTMVSMLATSRPEINGYSGVAPKADLIMLRPPLNEKHIMDTLSIMEAIDYCGQIGLSTGRRVIVNNSWGLFGCKNIKLPCRIALTRAMVALDRLGAICTVWAIGNNELIADCEASVRGWCMNTTPVSVSVGAATLGGNRQRYSSIGGQCYPLSPIVVAPTGGVVPWGDGFVDFGDQGGGTSAAAPQVAGALAILDTAFPNLSSAELRAALRAGATPIGPDPEFNPGTGAGMLRIDRALQAAPTAKDHPTYSYEQQFLAEVSTLT